MFLPALSGLGLCHWEFEGRMCGTSTDGASLPSQQEESENPVVERLMSNKLIHEKNTYLDKTEVKNNPVGMQLSHTYWTLPHLLHSHSQTTLPSIPHDSHLLSSSTHGFYHSPINNI